MCLGIINLHTHRQGIAMKTPLTAHRAPSNYTCLFLAESKYDWDVYQDEKGTLWSLSASDDSGKGDSMYGTPSHILKLMSNGHFEKKATEAGLAVFSGACAVLPDDYFERIAHYAKMRSISSLHYFKIYSYVPPRAMPKPPETALLEAA